MSANGSEMEAGEGFDRATLDFAGVQLDLLKQITALKRPTVLVTIAGRPLNLNWAADHVGAILYAWYPGEQGGAAVADTLFGHTNPSGRLPISVPRSVGQLPVYYNHKPDVRREYADESAAPLYPFGFGLSYTHFTYANARAEVAADAQVTIHVDVTNAGPRDGDEVVQCYLHHDVSSVTVPEQALKAFERLSLKAGQTCHVELHLGPSDLAVLDRQMTWAVEAGKYEARIGAASNDIRQRASFDIAATLRLPH
jgi:beta-glucosidase